MTSISKTKHVDPCSEQCLPNRALSSIQPTGSSLKVLLAATVAPLLMTGCEAPLNLEGVTQELQKQVRRTDQFQAIASNGATLVAVGDDGLVMTSPENKLAWTRQQISEQPPLVDVASCPDNSFVALSMDKKVWRSDDNGSSWQASDLPTQEDVMALTCAPDSSIWVVGSFSTILSSNDQGQNWNENTLGEDAFLTSIVFLDAHTAILTGEFGVVSRSDDGGQSWNEPEYIPNDFYIQGAHFNSVDVGWVAGLSGQILFTEDAGMNWTQQQTPTESPIYGFYRIDGELFAYGDHGTVLKLDGISWHKVAVEGGKPVYLRDAQRLNDGSLLLAGGSGSLLSLDLTSSLDLKPSIDPQLSQKLSHNTELSADSQLLNN
ncbi:MAG: YCF48-related protein [Motiliproteus sp.]